MQVLKDDIRRKITAEALTLFYRYGYAGTSMRMIAGRIPISVSNLYKYHAHKEELLSAVIGPYYRRIDSLLTGFLAHEHEAGLNDAPARELPAFLHTLVMLDRVRFVVLMKQSGGTPYGGYRNTIMTALAEHMTEYTPAGSVDAFIVKTIAGNLVDNIIAAAQEFTESRQIREAINGLVTYHIHGMKPLLRMKTPGS